MKKIACGVLMVSIGIASGIAIANSAKVLTPAYLSVPHYADCMVSQKAKTGTSTELVMPKKRPAKCPKSSWNTLKADFDKSAKDAKSSKHDDKDAKSSKHDDDVNSDSDTSKDDQQHLLKGQPQD